MSEDKEMKRRGKKRGAEPTTKTTGSVLETSSASSSSTSVVPASSFSSSLSSSSSSEDAVKRFRSTMCNMSKHLICPISHELMVEPVLAEDGHTYELAELRKWLALNSTSPFDPSCRIDSSKLRPNRAVKTQIEELMASGELDNSLCVAYSDRKHLLSPEHAQQLYDEGSVEEAAELGLPEAQGKMADRCYSGRFGVPKDLAKSVEWAKKAAAGGDKQGHFRLGYAFVEGHGGMTKDYLAASVCFEKAAELGHEVAMTNLGCLLKNGGYGLDRDQIQAVSWYLKAADAGCEHGQHITAWLYFHGTIVTKDLAKARSWFRKAADQGSAVATRCLGTMVVKGEGGAMDVNEGCALWEEAAAFGDEKARQNIDRLDVLLRHALTDASFEMF